MKYKEFKPQKTKTKKPWYIIYYKNYSIYLWGVPLLPFAILTDKIEENRKWCPHKAEKVINRGLPKMLDYDPEEDNYEYCMRWGTSWMYEYAPLHLKAWARKFQYSIKKYLLELYEHPMYNKTVIDDDCSFEKNLIFSKKPIDK